MNVKAWLGRLLSLSLIHILFSELSLPKVLEARDATEIKLRKLNIADHTYIIDSFFDGEDLVILLSDITDVKKMAEDLSQQFTHLLRFKMSMQCITDGIVVADAFERVVFMNATMHDIISVSYTHLQAHIDEDAGYHDGDAPGELAQGGLGLDAESDLQDHADGEGGQTHVILEERQHDEQDHADEGTDLVRRQGPGGLLPFFPATVLLHGTADQLHAAEDEEGDHGHGDGDHALREDCLLYTSRCV